MKLRWALFLSLLVCCAAQDECTTAGTCGGSEKQTDGEVQSATSTEQVPVMLNKLEDLFGPSVELNALRTILASKPTLSLENAVDILHRRLGPSYFAAQRALQHRDLSFAKLQQIYFAKLEAQDSNNNADPALSRSTRSPPPSQEAPTPKKHKKRSQRREVDPEEADDHARVLGDPSLAEYTSQYRRKGSKARYASQNEADDDLPILPDVDSEYGSAGPARSPQAFRPVVRPSVDGPKPISYHVPNEQPSHGHFKVISEWPGPRIYLVENFLSPEQVQYVLDMINKNIKRFSPRGETGISLEFPANEDPFMAELLQREYKLIGINASDSSGYFRIRRYERDEFHPLHTDTYSFGDNTLIATMLIYLTTPARGGETFFPKAYMNRNTATEEALKHFPDVDPKVPLDPATNLIVPAVAGNLVIWMSCTPDGQDDPLSLHGSMPLQDGVKWTATNFVYTALSECRFGPEQS